MTTAQEHYQHLLGRIYGWMIGDFDTAVDAAREDLRAAGLVEGDQRHAIDLGAGLGAHSLALAEAGYVVTAIDTCAELLDQLRTHAHRRITCIDDDLMAWRRYQNSADVVVCMGDTLTHLASTDAVAALFETLAEGLRPGGVFMATFRDYTIGIPPGAVRRIPVRGDRNRALTCVLEYGQTTVTVRDIVDERTDSGWTQDVGNYSKLRLGPDWTRATLEALGLKTMIETAPNGMVRLMARMR